MRWLAIIWTLLVATFAVACVGSAEVPALDDETSADLQAQAVWRACQDLACTDAPILVQSSTPGDVKEALAGFTDEITYVSRREAADRESFGEQFSDGATLFGVSRVESTKKIDVVRVDVSISRGPGDILVRSYLFQWDRSDWRAVSPDTVGVTVTEAVS